MANTRTEIALAKYRKHASRYDSTTHRTEPLRRRTIAHLCLRPGDAVLDVACGTGLSFALIQKEIGASGKLIGIEQCPQMMERARRRANAGGWENVLLIESPVEAAAIPFPVDAVLFNFTHDVLRSRAALEKIFDSARAGTTVAAAGMKLLPWWLAPANLYILLKAYPYVTTFEGLNRPWSLLQEYVPGLRIEPVFWGGGYLAFGTHGKPGRAAGKQSAGRLRPEEFFGKNRGVTTVPGTVPQSGALAKPRARWKRAVPGTVVTPLLSRR